MFGSSEELPSLGDDTRSLVPQLTPKVISSIVSLALGDARTALSLLELVLVSPKDTNESNLIFLLRQSVATSYDRTGDGLRRFWESKER